MPHPVNCSCCPNPVITEVPLDGIYGCNGWVLSLYADGMGSATDGKGLTMGYPIGPNFQTEIYENILECQGLIGR